MRKCAKKDNIFQILKKILLLIKKKNVELMCYGVSFNFFSLCIFIDKWYNLCEIFSWLKVLFYIYDYLCITVDYDELRNMQNKTIKSLTLIKIIYLPKINMVLL